MSLEYNIEQTDFTKIIDEKYLSYALSTIMSRSLPDVRDGLKPVHRRLLYAMLQLNLEPKNSYKKCARIVGDVIGKYHPHGDVAVYETLVRLAQSFSVRYPLVDGQGNFGSIDGDNAAAMRYTESKLTDAAMLLLNDIEKNTVDFKPTYDGNGNEPSLLPASFPNLLANGSEGIAVGMATSIPPHNISELIDASIALLKNPDLSVTNLLDYIKGPDFPTGGVIVEDKKNIISTYETGKGGIRLRAKWFREDLPYGTYQIVIHEIPYQVQKSRLIEKIADLYKDKKLPLLSNIKDESSEDIRIIIEPKIRNCNPEIIMESLFRLTDLEVRINVNMNVLNKNSFPGVMNLKQVIQSFLDYKYEIIIRKSNYRLNQIDYRLEIINGMLIAYLNIDELIRIIREEDEVKEIFIEKFNLTQIQVEAILNMKLRSLKKLEEIELKSEYNRLSLEKEELEKTINNKQKASKLIITELLQIQKKFDISTSIGRRRTEFAELPILKDSISIEAFIEKEPITIVCSKLGWIKSYKNHNLDRTEVKYKESDEERFIITGNNTDRLIIFAENGKFYNIACDKISRNKGYGDSIRLLIELEDNIDIITMFISNENRKFLVASHNGKAFIIEENELIAQTKSGKQILNLKDNDKALLCKLVDGDMIAIIGTNRKMVIYHTNEIPLMKRGQGITLQKYRHAVLADVKFFNEADGISWSYGSKKRVEKNLLPWLGKKGSVGRVLPNGFPKNNKF